MNLGVSVPAIGVVADEICEVADLDTRTPQKTPPIGVRWRPEFVAGIAEWKDELIVLPDLAKMLNEIVGQTNAIHGQGQAGERLRGDHRSVGRHWWRRVCEVE
jgi:chemotaxis signal transduction protein